MVHQLPEDVETFLLMGSIQSGFCLLHDDVCIVQRENIEKKIRNRTKICKNNHDTYSR